MKNITVSIDDETYRLSHEKAAEAGTSLSELVRDYLIELVQGEISETRFQRLARLQDETIDAIIERGGGLRMSDNLPREALYDRDAFR